MDEVRLTEIRDGIYALEKWRIGSLLTQIERHSLLLRELLESLTAARAEVERLTKERDAALAGLALWRDDSAAVHRRWHDEQAQANALRRAITDYLAWLRAVEDSECESCVTTALCDEHDPAVQDIDKLRAALTATPLPARRAAEQADDDELDIPTAEHAVARDAQALVSRRDFWGGLDYPLPAEYDELRSSLTALARLAPGGEATATFSP